MPDIQLYSLGSPNGIKIAIALEEMGVPYDAHFIDITKGEQFSESFLKINPNGKIPALIDLNGPENKPITIIESGAILNYLAEKYNKLIPHNLDEKCEVLQWLFFQAANIGPMFGAFGHFHTYGKDNCDHPYPEARFAKETMRLLQVLEDRLQTQEYIVGDAYSVADISIFPWVIWLDKYYKARDQLELDTFPHVMRWVEKCRDRPATLKAIKIFGFDKITGS